MNRVARLYADLAHVATHHLVLTVVVGAVFLGLVTWVTSRQPR